MTRWGLLLSIGCADATTKTSATEPSGEGAHHADTATDTHEPDATGEPSDSGTNPAVDHCVDPTNPTPLSEKNCVREAACLWNGAQYSGNFGHSLDVGGDIDGDGLVDWIIGAPFEDKLVGDEVSQLDVGSAHIFLGANRTIEPHASIQLLGTTAAANLGSAVIIAPDLNGDGLDDVVVGGRGTHTDTITAAGEVQLLFGRDGGWETASPEPDLTWYGEQEMARAGSVLAGLGDLNGDGLGELAVATNQRQTSASGYEQPGQGTVALFYGTEDFTAYPDLRSASAMISGVGPSDSAGASIASGDLNGDGYKDLIIGAPKGGSNHGRVVVLPGGTDPLVVSSGLDAAPIQLRGAEYSDNFGFAIAAGDLNADSIDELVVGAPTADHSAPEAGSVFVFTGITTFFDAAPEASHQFTGEWDDHQLGSGLQAGVDLNNDGIGDLMMGAVGAWQGLITKGGRTYTFHGPSTAWGSALPAATAHRQFFGADTKDYLGRAMDAQDIDGDGKTDVLLGSGFTNVGSNFDAGSVYLFWGD